MSEEIKRFLVGLLSLTIASTASSSISVYVTTQKQVVQIENLQKELTELRGLYRSLHRDLYQPVGKGSYIGPPP